MIADSRQETLQATSLRVDRVAFQVDVLASAVIPELLPGKEFVLRCVEWDHTQSALAHQRRL
jgi:hypothetical protein